MHGRVSFGAPIASVVLGLVLIGLTVSQGHATPQRAVEGIALLLLASGALVLLQFRSETARVLAGQSIDERWAAIHRSALAAAASIAIIVGVIAYAVVEVRGGENWQFALMLVVLTLGYLVALVWFRWRL